MSSMTPSSQDVGQFRSTLDVEIEYVISEMHNELSLLDKQDEGKGQFKNAKRLLAAEIEKLESRIEPEWLEVYIPKPIKITKKILIPTFRHPEVDFVETIVGRNQSNLQTMARDHKCHIYVQEGDRQMIDSKNIGDPLAFACSLVSEQELLSSGDPLHAHFGGPLHVKLETLAPIHIAYQRIAVALETITKILTPVDDKLEEIEGDVKKEEDKGTTSESA